MAGFKYNGYLLILNYTKFLDPAWTRTQTLQDVRKLRKHFERLGFRVQVKNNLDDIQTISALDALVADDKGILKQCAALWLIVMSHGDTTTEFLTSSYPLSHDLDVLPKFSDTNCPSLEGIPKIFLLLTCRGFATQVYHRRLGTATTPVQTAAPSAVPDSGESPGAAANTSSSTPEPTGELLRDTFVVYSTQEGFTTHRSPLTGSYAVNSLIKAIEDNPGMEFKEVLQEFKRDYEKTPKFGKVIETRDLGFNKSYYIQPSNGSDGSG